MTSQDRISTESVVRTPQRMKSIQLSSVPPSPCATSTTSSPATNRSLDYSVQTTGSNKVTLRYLSTNVQQMHSNPAVNHSKRFVPPSPSRNVLDPQYASRLHKSNNAYHVNVNDAMHPPGIHRGEMAKNPAFLSTPVQSVVSETDEPTMSTNMSCTSTQYFTPERPKRINTNVQTPSHTPNRGFYTPQSSPANRSFSFYSPGPGNNTTPSRNGMFHSTSIGKGTQKYSDRFIPSRVTSNLNFSIWDETANNGVHPTEEDTNSNFGNTSNDAEMDASVRQDGSSQNGQSTPNQQPLLNALLRSELLGENLEPSFSSMNHNMTTPTATNNERSGRSSQGSRPPLTEGRNFLRFNQSRRQVYHEQVFRQHAGVNPTSIVDSFNLSPVGIKSSHRLMNLPQKRKRKIAKVPFKVLDAPSLADDFYLNLVDWSSLNVLAVGLGSCVYLWSACTSKVTKLCDLGVSSQDSVTSVAWTQRGTHLAVGVNNGEVQIWDTIKCKKLRAMGGHSARIGALSWTGATLASGSRDRLIYLRDVRIPQPFTARLASHKQEVCGLKWSFDEPAHLASGGNDNKLLVWDVKNHRQPKHRFAEHTAAVKAIAWSPHQHGLLASGGGTADRCIRFWNALSGTSLNAIDTGSQVCNLSWSKNCNEIVSTHGYSLNQIAIWKYPTMQKVATLTGHTYRVLYLAMSPDGSTIVT